jgi:hypothetical protein
MSARHELRPVNVGEILNRTFFLYRQVSDSTLTSLDCDGVSVVASAGKITYVQLNNVPFKVQALVAADFFLQLLGIGSRFPAADGSVIQSLAC